MAVIWGFPHGSSKPVSPAGIYGMTSKLSLVHVMDYWLAIGIYTIISKIGHTQSGIVHHNLPTVYRIELSGLITQYLKILTANLPLSELTDSKHSTLGFRCFSEKSVQTEAVSRFLENRLVLTTTVCYSPAHFFALSNRSLTGEYSHEDVRGFSSLCTIL